MCRELKSASNHTIMLITFWTSAQIRYTNMSKKNDAFSSTFSVDFSSTTKLAGNVSDSKESINTKDCYNPYEHRQISHPNSTTGAIIHLLKSCLGSGILAMPNAFRNAGLLFGTIGTVVVGILCTYCIHMLVKASYEMCKRTQQPLLGFSETAHAAFKHGPNGIRRFSTFAACFVNAALISTHLLGDCVYIVFITENLRQVFDHWFPESQYSIYIYMLFILGPLLILAQVREVKHLVPFSFLANVFLVISFSITLYYMFKDIPDPNSRNLFAGFTTLPLFFSTVIFAMEGVGCVMPIENSMRKPQEFLGCPGVLNISMSIVVILYTIIGFFGYLKFGEETQGSITLNLPVNEIPAQIVKLLIALSVFFTYFLQMYVPIDIVWRQFVGPRIEGTTKRHVVQILIRCLFVCMTIGIAAAVPDLEPIIGLVGSICLSTLGLFIPAVLDMVILWDVGYGFLKWKLIKDVLLALFAIFALVTGTSLSISSLMK